MKLIVGLGNSGKKYENTRHNAGRLVEEAVSEELKIPPTRLTDFMNESGERVRKLIRQKKGSPADLLIIHDDLDIPLGSFKLQFGKGPRLHNGVNSIENALETQDFWRLRIGIEARDERLAVSGEEYVLQDFTGEEKKVIDQLIEEKIVPEIKNWLLKK